MQKKYQHEVSMALIVMSLTSHSTSLEEGCIVTGLA